MFYRLEGQRNGMTHGFRGAAPDLVRGERSAICRSRREGPRTCLHWWFRGFVSSGGPRPFEALPYRRERHLAINAFVSWWAPWPGPRGARSHITAPALRDKTTKPATRETAQPLAPRTVDVGMGTANEVRGPTTNPGNWQIRGPPNRDRQMPAELLPYDETSPPSARDCSAPGRVGFLLVSLLCRSKEE